MSLSSASEQSLSTKPRQLAPDVPANDQQALADGNLAFALDLYQALRAEQDDNFLFSPFSISQALAMTYAGARNATAQEMAQTLHFTLPPAQLHAAFNALDLQLNQPAPQLEEGEPQPFQLSLANSLWGQKDFAFLPDFLDTLAENYGAGLMQVDFVKDPEAARRQINAWVSEQTKEKIKDLLPPKIITIKTRLVLVNAIYFKADWLMPFDPQDTRPAPFYRLDGTTTDAPFMHGLVAVPYAHEDGYEAVALPYAGGDVSMLIIAPETGRFAEVEQALTAETLHALLQHMQTKSVQLALPKFEFEAEFNLTKKLGEMGMPSAITEGVADFSGMTDQDRLYIFAVVHKAMVAVDEKGTEAAAATAVVMNTESEPVVDVTLTLDRPFIFVIRDDATGAMLFVGRVVDPTP